MPEIIPRWEWRTFGAHFGLAEIRLEQLEPDAEQESEELYFLGGGRALVKIRDALMDVKVLREVDANGLERWEPVMKQGFPLAAADTAKVFALQGLAAPPCAREAYSLDQFVDELAVPSGLQPVSVRKHRVRYRIGGSAAELTRVEAAGKATRTIAIESEDPAAVAAAVASVGMGGCVNTNYAVGLRPLLDGAPERYAVIDVGSNSVKLHVAERDGGAWRAAVDRAELTRLAEGLEQSGDIAPAAAARTIDAVAAMVDEARRSGARAIAAVGTAALRMARNGGAVAEAIHTRTGVRVEVISAEEEARLAYLAVQVGLGMPQGSLAVFDTGGGSSQFTFGRGDRVIERFSLPVGAVRYTERFGLDGAVESGVLGKALAEIARDLSRLDGRGPPASVVGMGGAVTNLAAVQRALATYDPEVIQGSVLERSELDRQIEIYRSRDAAARRTIIGLQPKRAEVILAGACIVRTVMDKLGATALTVSDRGLRHGVVAERFGSGAAASA